MNLLARWWRPAGLAVVALIGVIFPLVFTNALDTQFAIDTLIFVAAVVAWNLFSGFSGYISLGHAVFFGTAAYTVAVITSHNHITGSAIFALIPVGGLAGAVIAVPFGLIALRVRRHTFVVITIAIFFIFQLMAYNLAITRGNGGIPAPFLQWDPATYNNPFYYAALIIAVLAIGLSWLIRGSRFGLQLLAIRDDEDRARGLGVHAMRVKLTAFVISAFFIGMIGALWFYFIGQAMPSTVFDPNFDLTVALMGFFGGFGTVAGPIVGALILEPLQQYVTLQVTNGYLALMFLGVLFLLVILFLPRGLVPTGSEWITKLRARRQQAAEPAGPAPPPPPTVPAGTGQASTSGTGGGR
jgi:branched-chain amino acid transport system permease protein